MSDRPSGSEMIEAERRRQVEKARLDALDLPEPPHTPGPWFYSHRQCPDGMYRTQAYDAGGAEIATFAWYPYQHPNSNEDIVGTSRAANARLAAAAPTLYDVLKDAIEKRLEEVEAFTQGFEDSQSSTRTPGIGAGGRTLVPACHDCEEPGKCAVLGCGAAAVCRLEHSGIGADMEQADGERESRGYCRYCGFMGELSTRAAVMAEMNGHAEQCELHPIRALRKEVHDLRAALRSSAQEDGEQGDGLLEALLDSEPRYTDNPHSIGMAPVRCAYCDAKLGDRGRSYAIDDHDWDCTWVWLIGLARAPVQPSPAPVTPEERGERVEGWAREWRPHLWKFSTIPDSGADTRGRDRRATLLIHGENPGTPEQESCKCHVCKQFRAMYASKPALDPCGDCDTPVTCVKRGTCNSLPTPEQPAQPVAQEGKEADEGVPWLSLEETCRVAADRFREYERLHDANGKAEKAESNGRMALMLEDALLAAALRSAQPAQPAAVESPERWALACRLAVEAIGNVNSGADLASEIVEALMKFGAPPAPSELDEDAHG